MPFPEVQLTRIIWITFLGYAMQRGCQGKVCKTSGCLRAAAAFLDSIDSSKNPCENFYDFACGNWMKKNSIPMDRAYISSFSKVNEAVIHDMLFLLEETEDNYNSSSIRITKQYYKKCMDTRSISALKSKPLHNFVRSLGGWPLINRNWARNGDINFTDLLTKINNEFNLQLFFSSSVIVDVRNVSSHVLGVSQGTLGLGRETRKYYLEGTSYEKQINAYKRSIFDFAKLIADDMNASDWDENYLNAEIEKMIDFERKFANISVPSEKMHNRTKLYNRRTLQQLGQNFSFLDWKEYYRHILPTEVFNKLIKNQAENFEVVVSVPNFLSEMSNLLANTDAWYFDARYEDANQKFLSVFIGRKRKEPRWKKCVHMASTLHMTFGAMFVRKHFSMSDKYEVVSMIDDSKKSFKIILDQLDWMDNETKIVALEKVNNMIENIAFPDLVMNDTALDDFYQNLNVQANDSQLSLLDISGLIGQWYKNYEFFKLLKPVDRHEFPDSPASVNAYYFGSKNSITFLAGLLRGPFFDSSYPKYGLFYEHYILRFFGESMYLNYGALGMIIGHEITHGFDNKGSQHDKTGALKNWWSPRAAKKFKNKKQCMVDQYSNYEVTDVNLTVNGKLTLGENIADNGGLKQAFLAYKLYSERNGSEFSLPALNLTNEQAFFVSFAMPWCTKRKKAAKILELLSDFHTPATFRVNGAVSNSLDFAQSFQCPIGSPMNPRKKCAVW